MKKVLILLSFLTLFPACRSAGKNEAKAVTGTNAPPTTGAVAATETKKEAQPVTKTREILCFKLVKKPAEAQEGPDCKAQTKEQFEETRRYIEEVKKKNEELLAQGKEPIEPEEEIYPIVIRDEDGNVTERLEVILENKDAVGGKYLSDVYPTVDEMGAPAIGFEFNPEGAKKFEHLTRNENLHRELAIVFDGVIQSAPTIKATISQRGIIHGNFTREEVDRIVSILKKPQER
jgi:preprotein translocase subunit SecD